MKTVINFFALVTLTASLLQADLKTDLISINNSLIELNSTISNVEISAEYMCAPLIALNQDASSIVDAITTVNNTFASPIILDNEILVLTQNIFTNIAAISNESLLLSNDITILAPSTEAITLTDGITAMLQLSSEIGEMSDRIGEMSDNILIMSDNIGLMADRIIETQLIQSENLLLTQNSILTTQTNILGLVGVIETASYDLSLDSLISEGNTLVVRMSLVGLTNLNMNYKLKNVKRDVKNYLLKVQDFNDVVNSDTLNNTLYINSDSLNSLTRLTLIMTSIGMLIEGYNISIVGLATITPKSILTGAMDSMLNISVDINKTSNSILEIADIILIMAGNIGLQADAILITQETQSLNIATVQASILASQISVLGIIALIN